MRILKCASNARTKERILPNLYTNQPGTPTATIECIEDTQTSTVTWQNEEGPSPLNRMDVFDVSATTIHVDDDLTYTYTPGEPNRFPYIRQGITSIKERLERAIEQRATTKNPFVQHFDRRAKLYTVIESLGATTNLTSLHSYLRLPPFFSAAKPPKSAMLEHQNATRR